MECATKIYLKNCNCILYYLPRFDDNVTICGRSNAKCVDKTLEEMQMGRNKSFVCDCLPGCFEITYESEISTSPLLVDAPILQKNNQSQPNVSYVQIFYKNYFYRSQQRDELIGFTEFLCKLINFANEMDNETRFKLLITAHCTEELCFLSIFLK